MTSKRFILILSGISTLLLILSTYATLAQPRISTPVLLSPTPITPDGYRETILSDIVVPLIVLVVGSILGAIGTVFFKPRIEHWAERRKLRLQEKQRERRLQEQAIQRRQIEDQRLRAYLDRVADLCSTTRIFIQDDPVPLDKIYTDVYILSRPQAFRRFDITRLRADPSLLRSAQRLHGDSFLEKPAADRLFILGKPGAGKTTFLRFIARQAAAGAIEKIPILVTLREWVDYDQHSRNQSEDGMDLLTFIIDQFEVCNFPAAGPFVEHLLEERDDALVLFDGLDEIRQEGDQRRRAIAALRDFSKRYERAQILITCRVAATDYSFEGFTYVEIADFTDDQIRSFVNNYFRDAPKTYDLFLEEIQRDQHRGLRELARTPLLLGLLCLSFEETLTFPRHRDEIYTEALDALLKKWDASRQVRRDQIYQNLSLKHKRGLLAHIAYETFEPGEYFLPQRNLETRIAEYIRNLPTASAGHKVDLESEVYGDAILKTIESQHGILVERAHRIHAFAHLTFQEYYAARYVVENVASGSLVRLLSHVTDDRWREVILLTSAMLGNADPFFDCFLEAMHDIVRDDEELISFLDWASRKATSVQVDCLPLSLRSYYCCLGLTLDGGLYADLDRVFDRVLDLGVDHALRALDSFSARIPDRDFARDLAQGLDRNLARDLSLDLDRVRAWDQARARARTLAQTQGCGLDLDRALTLALILARARTLDSTLDLVRVVALVLDLKLDQDFESILDRVLDRELGLATDLARPLALKLDPNLDRALSHTLRYIRNCAQELKLDSLNSKLSELSRPPDDATAEGWRDFAGHLRELMAKHRDIGHDWCFSHDQIGRLERYFYAAELLLGCLELAVVVDRAAIMDSLLLPPSLDATSGEERW